MSRSAPRGKGSLWPEGAALELSACLFERGGKRLMDKEKTV